LSLDSAAGVAAESTDGGKARLLQRLLSARGRVSCAGGVYPSRVWEGRRAAACWGRVCAGRLVVLGSPCTGSPERAAIFEPRSLKPHPTRAALQGGAMGSGKRRCTDPGCSKNVQSGGTPHCKAHGGGRRCQEAGCAKSAVSGGTPHCSAHGGGRRCEHEGCTKGATGDTRWCKAHGGGLRCQEEGCMTAAASGGHPNCTAHGGGKRCAVEGCCRLILSGRRPHCGDGHFQ